MSRASLRRVCDPVPVLPIAKPWLWLLAFLLAWLILVTVLIATGHGGPPTTRKPG